MRTYRDLARVLSPLLGWVAVGWAFFPPLVSILSKMAGEPFDVARASMVAYPFSLATLLLSLLLMLYCRH